MVHPYNRKCQALCPRGVILTEAVVIMRILCWQLCFKGGEMISLPHYGGTTRGKSRADGSWWVGGHFSLFNFFWNYVSVVENLDLNLIHTWNSTWLEPRLSGPHLNPVLGWGSRTTLVSPCRRQTELQRPWGSTFSGPNTSLNTEVPHRICLGKGGGKRGDASRKVDLEQNMKKGVFVN